MRIHGADDSVLCLMGKGNTVPFHPVLPRHTDIQHSRQKLRAKQVHFINIYNVSVCPSQKARFETAFPLAYRILQIDAAEEHVFCYVQGQVQQFPVS